ncbi:MAG TPA: DUF309 domain-containing protein [Planktothrix sp.]|jgi:hypothetical protein
MPDAEGVRREIEKGVAEFNRREFFQCHETLEDVWRIYSGAEREYIQGVIQLAVGYYHHLRGNQVGALKLLRRAHERILKFQPSCLGFDTKTLASAVLEDIERLTSKSENGAPNLAVPTIGYIRN